MPRTSKKKKYFSLIRVWYRQRFAGEDAWGEYNNTFVVEQGDVLSSLTQVRDILLDEELGLASCTAVQIDKYEFVASIDYP